jgi:DNA-binding XRE family transcriptional regulator
MAAKLGISQDTVEQIEKICIEEIKLREKRVKLMYPEGAPI